MIERINDCPICHGTNIVRVLEQNDVYSEDKQVFTVSECKDCSLLFLSTRPFEKEIGKYYDFDYQPFSSEYNKISEIFIDWRTRNEIKEFTIYNNNIKDVLDIGCANGAYLEKLRKNSNFVSFTGIDVNVPTIEKNKERNNLKLIAGDFLTTDFEQNSFDLIVMNHVIEHVYDPQKVIKKINSLLRPGGLFFIKTPNYLTLEQNFFRRYWYPYEIPRHTYIFSFKSLGMILKKSGFNIVLENFEKTPNNIILSINNYLLRKNKKSKLATFFSINNYLLLILFLPISIILGLFKQSGRIVLLAQKNK